MGLWTKFRLFGHGDAEPGLEAAEEMLRKENQVRVDLVAAKFVENTHFLYFDLFLLA